MTQSIKERISQLPQSVVMDREVKPLLDAILTDLTALTTQLNQLRSDMDGHTHGGITAGAGTSGTATTTATAVALTLTS